VDLWNDPAAFINAQPSGWVKEMGIRIVEATPERVTCEWDVTDKHHQGYGIVHGGVHAGVVETLASIGAALAARPSRVVGLENSTSFIRAVRSGRLHAAAQPITRGRRTQVWETSIWDEHEHLVAVGRLRLLCLEPEHKIG
jgi:1,4-dihydroxy-2-naphthoyl-CoA hydrolase